LASVEELLSIMRKLRDPDNGCPWDREQTFASIAPYTIEEAYEVADAIQRDDMPHLCEELGDLLFQVVFHAQMAAESGFFDFEDVVSSIVTKMRRRHPHVFGNEQIADAREQTLAWEQHKESERQQKKSINTNHSILDGVPITLPGLTRAVKLQKRAARVGFDWTSVTPIFEKIVEELNEVKHEVDHQAARKLVEEEIGDLFFAVANLARHLDIDPETAVRRSNNKFEQRFKSVEKLAGEQNRQVAHMSLDEMEELYQQVKRSEK